MCTGTVTESQQPMETGCSAVPPAVSFLLPTCLLWKTPKVGTVYRAIACKTFPRSPSDICAVNAAELRPHLLLLEKKKKAKKSILLVFKHKHLTRIGGRGVDLCALAAPRSDVHLWQVLSAENTATERAVRFRSHYAICFSTLLLLGADICSRGLPGGGGAFFRGRGGGGGGGEPCACQLLREIRKQTEINI